MRNWLALFAMIVALGLVTPTLMADHDKHKGKGHAHFDEDDQGGDRDERWEHRDGYEYRIYHDGRPPGWSRGRKTGWGNCALPPGQAKKYGCRTYVYERRRYYYYEDDDRHIIVRRPVVHIHAGVDIIQ